MNNNTTTTVFEFKTIQGYIIKNLFESIKEILTDVNLNFTETSIQCTAIDGNKIACVYFKLEAEKFEYYKCTGNMVIGINMQSLFKLIRTITSNDTIAMKIYDHERHRLHIIIENTEKHTLTTSILKLLDIDEQHITIPDIEFDNIITIPCADFQRYCKDMMMISNTVIMTCKKKKFILSCSGDFADYTIEINECNTSSIMDEEEDDETFNDMSESGRFSLKYINLFIKSSSLCNTVEIYLKKEYPLILIYRIGSLGKIQFCLAPNQN